MPFNAMTNNQLKSRLYRAALLILAAGCCAAVAAWFAADDVPVDAAGYVVVDGVAYPIAPQHSKRYVRELERFGGKASVVMDELDRWFGSLWRGRSLAGTIAWLSAIVAAGLALFARWLPPDRE
jgi:hypothetical protein